MSARSGSLWNLVVHPKDRWTKALRILRTDGASAARSFLKPPGATLMSLFQPLEISEGYRDVIDWNDPMELDSWHIASDNDVGGKSTVKLEMLEGEFNFDAPSGSKEIITRKSRIRELLACFFILKLILKAVRFSGELKNFRQPEFEPDARNRDFAINEFIESDDDYQFKGYGGVFSPLPEFPADLSSFDALALNVRTDGRAYTLSMRVRAHGYVTSQSVMNAPSTLNYQVRIPASGASSLPVDQKPFEYKFVREMVVNMEHLLFAF